eukprot:5700793-Pleurochrysis_carterae.AAC.1
MLCLASARRPDALQGRKLEPCADKCVHLGTSPNEPGYRLELLEGPRKGKLITMTQVVFRETVLPLRAEYQPPEDDSDGPSTDEYMVMVNPDENDLENGPSLVVTPGPDTLSDDDGDNATPTVAADNSIASGVRRQGAPRQMLPQSTFTFQPKRGVLHTRTVS